MLKMFDNIHKYQLTLHVNFLIPLNGAAGAFSELVPHGVDTLLHFFSCLNIVVICFIVQKILIVFNEIQYQGSVNLQLFISLIMKLPALIMKLIQ